jgi:hypothetical protein
LGTTLTNQNSFQKKLKADWNQGTLAIIWCGIFCLPVCYPKILRLIYRTIILPAVLYGCETWLLTFREECRLSVFEKRMLKRTFRPKRDKVIGNWSKLHTEELNDLYSSPNIIRVIKSR